MKERSVKRILDWLSLVATIVGLFLSSIASAQPIEVEATGYKHAFVDPNTGQRWGLLTGGSVTNISNQELFLYSGVRFQLFDDVGKTNLDVTSPQCVYNTKTETVYSTNRLKAASGDAQFSLEGEGFEYRRVEGQLTVFNEVHAMIAKGLLAAETRSTNAPARPAVASTNLLTEAQLLHIYSDHLLYQTNLAVFGDVVRVEDPQGKLTCGVLTVKFSEPQSDQKERQRVESILAEQNVVVDSEQVHATGDRAAYELATDTVQLSGSPIWRIGLREGRSDEITVNRKTRAFHASRNVEIALPAGSIGRNGFLPVEAVATNAPSASGQPAHVFADDFEYLTGITDTNLNVAMFRGSVRVRAEKGNLSCGRLKIQSRAQSGQTESVVAEEDVVLEQGASRATGAKAVYTAATDTVQLTGHPSWKMGQREGTAEVLSFDLTNGVYRAIGDARMRLTAGAFGRTPWLLPDVGAIKGEQTSKLPVSSAGQNQPATNRTERPIEVSSHEFEYRPDAANTNLNLAIYRGKVRVSDLDRMELTCDLLTVTGRILPGTNQVESVAADGNVEMEVRESVGTRHARGDRAVYSASTGQVTMTDRHEVEIVVADARGVSRATGAKAVYDGGKDALELTGNPLVKTSAGTASGDEIVLDHANTTIKATGNWKLEIKAGALKKIMEPKPQPTAPKEKAPAGS